METFGLCRASEGSVCDAHRSHRASTTAVQNALHGVECLETGCKGSRGKGIPS